MLGAALDCRSRLTVTSACGSSRSHNAGGKISAVPANTLRKQALKFQMATSAALRQYQPGGTNSSFILYSSRMMVFMAVDTSLSRMCFWVTIPACFSRSIMARYALVSSASMRFLMGSNRMALLSISTTTMMYLLPRLDLVGN